MRRMRYSVAMSLDGYIAGPNGEYDWIEVDPNAGAAYFKAFYAQFDTAIMGRKSYEQAQGHLALGRRRALRQLGRGGPRRYRRGRVCFPGIRCWSTTCSAGRAGQRQRRSANVDEGPLVRSRRSVQSSRLRGGTPR